MIARHLPMRGAMLAFTDPLEEFFASQLMTVGSMAAAASDEYFRKNCHKMAVETSIVDCEGRKVGALVLRTREAMAMFRAVISVGAKEVARQGGEEAQAATISVADMITKALTDLLGESAEPVPSSKLVTP